jgi:hypothetical protein
MVGEAAQMREETSRRILAEHATGRNERCSGFPSFRLLTSDMKSPLDPKGTIAPGKHGIT